MQNSSFQGNNEALKIASEHQNETKTKWGSINILSGITLQTEIFNRIR